MQNKPKLSLTLFGIGVIVLGLVLTAGAIRLIDASAVIAHSWPLIFVAAGLVMLVGHRGSVLLGIGLMWLGALLLLDQFGVFGSQTGKTVLAGIVLITGVLLMVAAGDKYEHDDKQ